MNKTNDLIENFEHAKVLLIGDIMLDRFIYGKAERISPEGPIPVLSIECENEMLGGAGNVLRNMLSLGGQVDIIAVLGDDEAGKTVRAYVSGAGAKADYLIEDQSRPTILKSRYIAQNQQLLRVDHEKESLISQNIEADILTKAEQLLKDKNILVLSDYGKGTLTDGLIRSLIDLAQKNNVTILVDPKGKDFSKYKGADIITPNKKELSQAADGVSVSTDEDIESAAQKLIKKYQLKNIIATRAEDGMSVVGEGKPIHISTKAREVYDVSGAGDTVVATIAVVLGAGGSLSQAAEVANSAGGLVVAKMGTAVVTKAELQNSLQESNINSSSFISPVLKTEAALNQIQQWKAQGFKVGLTNGCFDILHYGHVNYLSRAREKCDRLIVALNHDKSVKILKGLSRPVNDENARAVVVAALGSCDMVVFFGAEKEGEDNTPTSLVGTLKPDIFFKGGDYTMDQLPEGKIVLAYGGEVDIMPLYDGYSTTNIIEKAGNC